MGSPLPFSAPFIWMLNIFPPKTMGCPEPNRRRHSPLGVSDFPPTSLPSVIIESRHLKSNHFSFQFTISPPRPLFSTLDQPDVPSASPSFEFFFNLVRHFD